MYDKLTKEVVYDNGIYRVERLDNTEDEAGSVKPNWAILNNEHSTIEQCSHILPGAIQTANMLKTELENIMIEVAVETENVVAIQPDPATKQ